MLELRALIKGHVQGVGFRYSVQDYANQLRIYGLVRNLPDGSVELVAQAPIEKLEQFLEKIRDKPGLGHVDSIEVAYMEMKFPYHTFKIAH